MIEPTLASFGKFIADKADIEKRQIAFTDKENLFNFLTKQDLPIELPAIVYYCNDITDPQQLRPQKLIGEHGTNFTTVKDITLIPVNLSISIVFLTSNLDDYFRLLNIYWLLIKIGFFEVEIINEDINGIFKSIITNHSSLSTPPGGREGRDFDRGRYNVLEGSFELSSYAAFYADTPVIRKFRYSTDWGGINTLSVTIEK
jgi:hypothetical protein